MLTQQLRELEVDGIILRKVYNQVPPKVEYCLSDYCNSLGDLLDLLCRWGEKHVEVLQQNGRSVELRCD